MTGVQEVCPICDQGQLVTFYTVQNVPVHSMSLLQTKRAALNCARGDIELGCCPVCGFIGNRVFAAQRMHYSDRYEATQSYSGTFNHYHHRLAQHLIRRYALTHKDIVEIGCGHGEFLHLLCTLGNNRGTGFDPAARATSGSVRIVPKPFSAKLPHSHGDFYVCKMTLEHIADPLSFVREVRRAVQKRTDVAVFFQVPDMSRILEGGAFWDIYYEHCAYFGAQALTALFQRAWFAPTLVYTAYAGQYLLIEAEPAPEGTEKVVSQPATEACILEATARFCARADELQRHWRARLTRAQRPVLWGGGSKAVAFLHAMGPDCGVNVVVDINPGRQQTFLAGGGQAICAPDVLRSYRPDLVVVMNPAYRDEIAATLRDLGITTELALLHDYGTD